MCVIINNLLFYILKCYGDNCDNKIWYFNLLEKYIEYKYKCECYCFYLGLYKNVGISFKSKKGLLNVDIFKIKLIVGYFCIVV